MDGALDQINFVRPDEMVQLDDIDRLVSRSITASQPSIIEDWIDATWRQSGLTGLKLCKALFLYKTKIYDRNPAMDVDEREIDFDDYAESRFGKTKQTIRKYRELWESVFEDDGVANNTAIKTALMGHRLRDLLLLTPAAKAGQLDDEWKRVAQSANGRDLREIVREVRGVQRSGVPAVNIFIDRTGTTPGRLSVKRTGEMRYRTIGYLNLEQAKGDEDMEKAIARILANCGILERN